MQSRTTVVTVMALYLAAGLAVAAPARAAEPLQISGKNTCKTTEQHAIPVEGDPDRVLVVEKGICMVTATGQSSMFDGGQELWAETGEFVKGNGTAHGYLLGKYKDGTIAFTYTTHVTTTMVDGKPHTTFYGEIESTSASGSMADTHTKGTFKGEPVSATEAAIEWQSTFTEASKQ